MQVSVVIYLKVKGSQYKFSTKDLFDLVISKNW